MDCFDGFIYIVFGYLYYLYVIWYLFIFYSGFFLKYLFLEVNDYKSVWIVELEGKELVSVMECFLILKYDMCIIFGMLVELIENLVENFDDFF